MSRIHDVLEGRVSCKRCTRTVTMSDKGRVGEYVRTEFMCGCTTRRSDFPIDSVRSGHNTGWDRIRFDMIALGAIGVWSP